MTQRYVRPPVAGRFLVGDWLAPVQAFSSAWSDRSALRMGNQHIIARQLGLLIATSEIRQNGRRRSWLCAGHRAVARLPVSANPAVFSGLAVGVVLP
jgi:hypothetical protein